MRIAIATISQETCSFSAVQTTRRDFEKNVLKTGSAFLEEPLDGVFDGFVSEIRLHKELECVGIVAAKATSGGALTADTFAGLRELLLDGLRDAGRVDVVYLALHGAMAADGEPDTEGNLLAATRELVGPDCFIGVTLDHHANVTDRMVAAADVMVGYETQPHDQFGAGTKTARVMLDIWDKKRKPVAVLEKVPMLAPQDNFLTNAGPMKEWFDLAREMERDPTVIVASPFPTQPWLDVPDNGWSCLVYADDSATARRYAKQLAQKAWELREQFWRSERIPIADAVKAANNEPRGLVVLADTGDAVYGGAPGDNMSIAAAMLDADLPAPALVPVVDPAGVAAAWAAGVGTELTLEIGGKMTSGYSPRLKVAGRVGALAAPDGSRMPGWNDQIAGKTVLFERGNLKIVLLELRERVINHPLLYQRLGLDVGKAQMAVLKTGSNFQYFKQYQSRLIRVDSPGPTQSDLTAFKWRHMTKPMYPFSKEANYE